MSTNFSFPDDLHNLRLSSEDGRIVLKIYSHGDLPSITRTLQERGEAPTFPFSGVRAKFSTETDVCRHVQYSLEGLTNKETVPFCIFVDGHVRGVVQLREVDLIDRRATIVWLVIDPDFQGQGIGSQALRSLVRWAMDTVGFDTLLAEVAKENESSRKVFRRCNFRYRGERELFYLDVSGRKNTLVIYQVTKENWDKPLTQYEIYKERLISNLLK
jgi:RimJ/RimL family protein N-acetyltransferase